MRPVTEWRTESKAHLTDDDGRQHTVVTKKEYIRQQFEDGTWEESKNGERRFFLSSGERLRVIEGDRLQIPSTGVMLPMPPSTL